MTVVEGEKLVGKRGYFCRQVAYVKRQFVFREVKETDDDKVVKVYVTEGTIVDDESGDDYREYNDYNTDDDTNDYDTITPIGDLKNDMDPDPNVVHIKNIKCPSCGAYSYIEHYNLKDENLLFYMGTCNSCGYER